ncbi:MAG TPA: DUF4956 domain-containing protein [Verrucomicrobiota bacterium]|nr:DUF4956 domain-containing protein [Verrucomicrobiales bacterium]HRI14680.1 DUF4956 domain-containing protein [Verrucomicrobiota bacterium]
MNKNETLLEFFSTQGAEIHYGLFLINFLLAALLAQVLGLAYARFGHALSNRQLFGRNFVVLTMTTMLIITIVKSSLALSLGLVGALSIIRFRAAIKEPEELGYLFICIAIGLGLGAQQTIITLIAFVVLLGVIALSHWVRGREAGPNLYLTVSSPRGNGTGLPELLAGIKRHADAVKLRRFDETDSQIEASFQVAFNDVGQVEACLQHFRTTLGDTRVRFVDDRGIGN